MSSDYSSPEPSPKPRPKKRRAEQLVTSIPLKLLNQHLSPKVTPLSIDQSDDRMHSGDDILAVDSVPFSQEYVESIEETQPTSPSPVIPLQLNERKPLQLIEPVREPLQSIEPVREPLQSIESLWTSVLDYSTDRSMGGCPRKKSIRKKKLLLQLRNKKLCTSADELSVARQRECRHKRNRGSPGKRPIIRPHTTPSGRSPVLTTPTIEAGSTESFSKDQPIVGDIGQTTPTRRSQHSSDSDTVLTTPTSVTKTRKISASKFLFTSKPVARPSAIPVRAVHQTSSSDSGIAYNNVLCYYYHTYRF